MEELDKEYRTIIDSLYGASLSGELVWTRKNITSELLTLNTKGEDNSEFEMVFYWSFNGTIWKLADPYIKVKNSKIEFSINQNISNKIFELRDLLQKKYCPDFIKTDKDTLEIISSITRGISKSEFRNNKLTKILKND